jgi:hypothetical protein
MKTPIFTLALIVTAALTTSAATFTVTTPIDSGPGSLRQAILDANANPGPDTIAFAIGSGAQTSVPLSPLPTITDPVVIDGWTQPGFEDKPLIELNGASAGTGTPGLVVSAGQSIVRGLVINRFKGDGLQLMTGGGNIVEGNFIGLGLDGLTDRGNGGHGVRIAESSYNLVGGTSVASRNVISGNAWAGVICFTNANCNRIQGNIVGLNSEGTLDRGNGNNGISIRWHSSSNLVGGSVTGAGNVISGNNDNGIYLTDGCTGNVIQGNLIGTDITGTIARGNSYRGIHIDGCGNVGNLIGGDTPTARNLVSGNGKSGIATCSSTRIIGNLIGTDITGTGAIGNGIAGVYLGGSDNYVASNRLAFSHNDGVFVEKDGKRNPILGNAIFENSELGIDLSPPDGVTPNDLGDADNGANFLQNFPVIASAFSGAHGLIVSGTLDTTPNRAGIRIEFFANAACDPTGYGEGQIFLGFTNVATDGAGNASFSVTLPVSVPMGHFISTTATLEDNTSEFSACVPVVLDPALTPRLDFHCLYLNRSQLAIHWPTNVVGLQLEVAGHLPTKNWVPVAVTPIVTNGLWSVNLPTTNPAAFFRLRMTNSF